MKVRFADASLHRLETEQSYTGGFGESVVRGFRKVMQFLRSAENETDLYAMKSLRFEKLKGNRAHQRSLRINGQWRLILEIEQGNPKNTAVVHGIEDYH